MAARALESALETGRHFFLWDPARHAGDAVFRELLLLSDPVKVLRADGTDEVETCLRNAEEYLRDGFYVAGFVCYHAGAFFEESLRGISIEHPLPAAELVAYRNVLNLGTGTFDKQFTNKAYDTPVTETDSPRLNRPCLPPAWNLELRDGKTDYIEKLARIHKALADGETYQVNLTTELFFNLNTDPISFYLWLRNRQPVPYGALLRRPGEGWVMSFSPELFFQLEPLEPGGKEVGFANSRRMITSKPMKGTLPRKPNATEADDAAAAELLASDEKTRAENAMIVDLVRNDLGRICRHGSVKVSAPFAVESHPTVYQVTTTVSGVLEGGTGLAEIFRAIFPCGSVTGAPKIQTMRIIDDLEKRTRGVYTGAVGLCSPEGGCAWNVAIRTPVVDENGRATMGTGGGIVWDSDPESEYEEVLAKTLFLTYGTMPDFYLIETMRLEADTGRLWNIVLHLQRLEKSCKKFGFPFDDSAILRRLEKYAAATLLIHPGSDRLVRLALFPDGGVEMTSRELTPATTPVQACLATIPVDSGDIFRRHKTSKRRIFDETLSRATAAGCWDAVFLNEHGRVTEGARSSVFLERNGRWYSPPLSEGLLPGVLRYNFESITGMKLVEKPLFPEDLHNGNLHLGSSARGLLATRLNSNKFL